MLNLIAIQIARLGIVNLNMANAVIAAISTGKHVRIRIRLRKEVQLISILDKRNQKQQSQYCTINYKLYPGVLVRKRVSETYQESHRRYGKKQDIKFSTTEKCNTCKGNGSKPGHSPDRCTVCGGNGKVRSNQGFFTVQQTCPQCAGSGEEITNPCTDCNGQGNKQASKKISVTIPKGVDDGTRIRLAGKGEAGSKGGASGDLYLFINVHSHDLFKRSDENLFFEFPISIADAALGTTIEIPTIDGGKAKIKIPDGTQNGKQFRLKGKGMPYMRGSGNGDLYVQVNTEVPISLNKEQKALLEKFREIENEKSNPSIKQFFQKAKSFWKN